MVMIDMANSSNFRKNDQENNAGFYRAPQKRKVKGQRRKRTERDIIENGMEDLDMSFDTDEQLMDEGQNGAD